VLYELQPAHFGRCSELVNLLGQLEVRAIIGGNNPGRVFVDNEENPSTGLVWLGNLDGFFFIGREDNEEFNREAPQFIERVIGPQARDQGVEWFECFGNRPQWDKVIKKIFAGREMETWKQKVFSLTPEKMQPLKKPDGYSLIKINGESFAPTLENYRYWQERIIEFWGDISSFLEKGTGYGVLQGDKLVGMCLSGFVWEGVHGVDIEILPDYQGQKLGSLISQAFLNECSRRGWTAYWDCMEQNRASEAIARKIGLQEQFSYQGFEFELK